MQPDPTDRKLAAIMAADVVGFSGLVADNEAATLAALKTLREVVMAPQISAHRGRMIKSSGDGFLVEFPSAVEAVRCALSIQTRIARDDGPLRLRIGINVGDVVVDGDDVMGDGVNIAARLEAEAAPGGIALSGIVRESIIGRVDAELRDGGTPALKNIRRPVAVWHWTPEGNKAVPGAHRARPDKPSIVVLPFDTIAADAEKDYLADGFVESITAALSRIGSFFVIARNSAFAYKGRHVHIRQIGQDLGVAYALEGSVQQAGNRLRVTVQLIETASDAHIWSERYDGILDDIFDLQDRITEQVAGALQPSIRLAEVQRARAKRPQDLDAYDYTMRAMRHVWMLENDEATRALDLLNAALAIDPDYPLALALAGWCHAQHYAYNWSGNSPDTMAQARQLAERAANLGADDPLTLAVLGAVLTLAGEADTARMYLERSVEIDPNSAWALSRLGWLEAYSGNADAAEVHFRRAQQLSPMDPLNFNTYAGLGAARLQIMDFAGGIPHLERALRERPGAHWIWRSLAVAYSGAGLEDKARTAARNLMRLQPNYTIAQYLRVLPIRPHVKVAFADILRKLGLPEG